LGLIGTAGDTGGTSGVGLIMIGVSIMGLGGLMIKEAPIARPVSDDDCVQIPLLYSTLYLG
jgi:hypothetical protein